MTKDIDTGLPGNKLYINREKWLRGGEGLLLRSDGKMCCLGFMACQLGAQVKDIQGNGSPEDVETVKWPAFMLRYLEGDSIPNNSHFTDQAIEINDDDKTSDEQREKDLTAHFAKQGIEVIFV